nr:MAG TPA: hypothetical protein [Caudoviricetes sp.]
MLSTKKLIYIAAVSNRIFGKIKRILLKSSYL